jgi:hypothetical protein
MAVDPGLDADPSIPQSVSLETESPLTSNQLFPACSTARSTILPSLIPGVRIDSVTGDENMR